MHPQDLAKIGLLMLQGGRWEDKQIVPAEWVKAATSKQKATGDGDDYGYGWWVPPPTELVEFAAAGRGGQYIRVFPELNLVIVTTGNGFDWQEIVPLLQGAAVDFTQPLPANPGAEAQLQETLAAILKPPSPKPVPPLPDAALEISGKTYAFEPNPLDLRTLRLDFDQPATARLQVSFRSQPDQDLRLGLDGVYRLFPVGQNGLPLGLRGSWTDDHTFSLEYDQIANIDAFTLEMVFEGDKVMITSSERTHEGLVMVEGWKE